MKLVSYKKLFLCAAIVVGYSFSLSSVSAMEDLLKDDSSGAMENQKIEDLALSKDELNSFIKELDQPLKGNSSLLTPFSSAAKMNRKPLNEVIQNESNQFRAKFNINIDSEDRDQNITIQKIIFYNDFKVIFNLLTKMKSQEEHQSNFKRHSKLYILYAYPKLVEIFTERVNEYAKLFKYSVPTWTMQPTDSMDYYTSLFGMTLFNFKNMLVDLFKVPENEASKGISTLVTIHENSRKILEEENIDYLECFQEYERQFTFSFNNFIQVESKLPALLCVHFSELQKQKELSALTFENKEKILIDKHHKEIEFFKSTSQKMTNLCKKQVQTILELTEVNHKYKKQNDEFFNQIHMKENGNKSKKGKKIKNPQNKNSLNTTEITQNDSESNTTVQNAPLVEKLTKEIEKLKYKSIKELEKLKNSHKIEIEKSNNSIEILKSESQIEIQKLMKRIESLNRNQENSIKNKIKLETKIEKLIEANNNQFEKNKDLIEKNKDLKFQLDEVEKNIGKLELDINELKEKLQSAELEKNQVQKKHNEMKEIYKVFSGSHAKEMFKNVVETSINQENIILRQEYENLFIENGQLTQQIFYLTQELTEFRNNLYNSQNQNQSKRTNQNTDK